MISWIQKPRGTEILVQSERRVLELEGALPVLDQADAPFASIKPGQILPHKQIADRTRLRGCSAKRCASFLLI